MFIDLPVLPLFVVTLAVILLLRFIMSAVFVIGMSSFSTLIPILILMVIIIIVIVFLLLLQLLRLLVVSVILLLLLVIILRDLFLLLSLLPPCMAIYSHISLP